MRLPTLRSERLTLRPPTDDDLDRLARLIRTPGIGEWWDPPRGFERDREGLANEGRAFAIEVDGELAGWLGFDEELDEDYRVASLDIALDERFRDRGLGPEAIRTAIRWLADEHGHHRFTIDPATANDRAIRAYESIGFRPVGVLRRYDRGPDGEWRDALLMDLLVEELRQ